MFIKHFNENLLLQVPAVVFPAYTFATCLGGTRVAKVICTGISTVLQVTVQWRRLQLLKHHYSREGCTSASDQPYQRTTYKINSY